MEEVNGRPAQQARLPLLKCGFTTLCGHRAWPLTGRCDGDSLMGFCSGLGLAKRKCQLFREGVWSLGGRFSRQQVSAGF